MSTFRLRLFAAGTAAMLACLPPTPAAAAGPLLLAPLLLRHLIGGVARLATLPLMIAASTSTAGRPQASHPVRPGYAADGPSYYGQPSAYRAPPSFYALPPVSYREPAQYYSAPYYRPTPSYLRTAPRFYGPPRGYYAPAMRYSGAHGGQFSYRSGRFSYRRR